jgi:hypothetical protein
VNNNTQNAASRGNERPRRHTTFRIKRETKGENAHRLAPCATRSSTDSSSCPRLPPASLGTVRRISIQPNNNNEKKKKKKKKRWSVCNFMRAAFPSKTLSLGRRRRHGEENGISNVKKRPSPSPAFALPLFPSRLFSREQEEQEQEEEEERRRREKIQKRSLSLLHINE